MSLPVLSEHTPRGALRPGSALAVLALALLCACSGEPQRPPPPPAAPAAKPTAAPPAVAAGQAAPATGTAPGAGAAGAPGAAAAPLRPEVTPAARADFNRAVNYMRAGNATEAELGFKQLAVQYPQY